jgi:DNA topoisomerase-3
MPIAEKQVYDTIARRFIAAFYPDCVSANTTVLGDVDGNEFTATGKVILEEGWRILYPKKDSDEKDDDVQTMPLFVKGEKGKHIPDLQEKQTQPPKQHTEATLLRAMETAGKQVDDLELRELMKDNGIGRPSTRANIIETLFKRSYITRQKKNLIPTITGIELIKTINNELLKSAELTGIWEKKLRQIEKGEYNPQLFLEEMKTMVSDLVHEVKYDHCAKITIEEVAKKIEVPQSAIKEEKVKTEPVKKKESEAQKEISAEKIACPKCKQGFIIKGRSAYGCNAFKTGCHFKVDFEYLQKKLTEKQIFTLIQKRKIPIIKGFTLNGAKVNGCVLLSDDCQVTFEQEI